VEPYPFSLSIWQSLKIVFKLVGGQLGLFLVIGFAVGFWSALHHHPQTAHPDGGPVGLIVVNTLVCLIVLRSELRRHQIQWRTLGAWRIVPVTLVAPFFLIVLGAVVLVSESANYLKAVLPPPVWFTAQFSELHNLAAHPVSGPLALIVMAPLTEEVIFRGLILRGLLARISPWRAIAISTLLFALLHLNPWQFPVAFGTGLVLGWAYYRTGSLSLCMAGHALINAISLLAMGLPFVVRGFNSVPLAGTVDFQPGWFDLAGVALVIGGAVWFRFLTVSLVGIGEPPPLPVYKNQSSVLDSIRP
jgi:membrane protease YdiL (CAAX protease family)